MEGDSSPDEADSLASTKMIKIGSPAVSEEASVDSTSPPPPRPSEPVAVQPSPLRPVATTTTRGESSKEEVEDSAVSLRKVLHRVSPLVAGAAKPANVATSPKSVASSDADSSGSPGGKKRQSVFKKMFKVCEAPL
jgi:hypothetical protein